MATLHLTKGRNNTVSRQHPWIFSGSVASVEGHLKAGDTVSVLDSRGRSIGKAAYSPDSQIRARMWSFNADEVIDHAFFKRKIGAAVARRNTNPLLAGQTGRRLIHGESDGLPGIIADQFGDVIAVQLTSAGADKWREAIVGALRQSVPCMAIYERSDSEVRRQEGLEPVSGLLFGELPEEISITEYGVRLVVDVERGHKTGFYLDQRENRKLCGELSRGAKLLNCFCYSAGFSMQALAGGAEHVVSVDSSAEALQLAERNLALNPQLDAGRAEFVRANVFDLLREFRDQQRQFDFIILDPPKFAPSARHAEQAARAYRDINQLGFRLLKPGGRMMTYSCSGGIDLENFQNIVSRAACDAQASAVILQRLQASADHPIGMAVPEGEYLKGLLCERLR